MESDLQNIVDKWVDEPTPDLKDVSVVTVTPDFDTPLPESYPWKEKSVTLKEGVRIAANTASINNLTASQNAIFYKKLNYSDGAVDGSVYKFDLS